MSLNCDCESLGVLPNLLDATCPVDYDQIVKIAFQLRQADETFATATPITDDSSWVTLATASDATKVVFSPALANVVIPSSEATYMGENSNESVNGLGYLLGEQNIRITGQIHSNEQKIADALSALTCYSDAALGTSNLTAFFFTRRVRGRSGVIAKAGDATGDYAGIPIFNFRLSSVGSEGYQAKNVYNFSFDLMPDELTGTEKVAITFNPLNLTNVASV